MEKNSNCSHNLENNLCTNKISLFNSLSLKDQEKLVDQAYHKSYKKDSMLFFEGEACDRIHIIRIGKVKLIKIDSDGKESILDILLAGDVIGEEVFLKKEKYSYSAVCLSDIDTCEIRTLTFEDLLKNNPQTSINLIHSLSKKLKDQEVRNAILVEKDSLKKLAGFFIQRSHKINSLNIKLSLDDIAASINLRPETVSRRIKELTDLGLIQRNKRESIKILNLEKLKAMI